MTTTNQQNAAALLHLSVFAQYLFPFGNFVLPIVIWSSLREKSSFVDENGKNAVNFQLSILVYTIILVVIAIPGVLWCVFRHGGWNALADGDFRLAAGDVTGAAWVALIAAGAFAAMKLAELFLVVFASVRAANGEAYRYPATIPFVKSSSQVRDTVPVN
jgi:uncharacterized Tic20 family protein